MARYTLPRRGSSKHCWITPDGMINFPQPVIARLGWQIKQPIRVDAIKTVLWLLFVVDEQSDEGHSLQALNRNGKGGSGGKLSCRGITRSLLKSRVELPCYGLQPIYPSHNQTDLVLMLEEPNWIGFDFDMAGCQSIPAKTRGVYEIISHNDVLKIGESNDVQSRIRDEHLKNDALVRGAKSARYMAVADKEEALLIEHVLLSDHEEKHGILPQFNRIKA